MTKDETLRLALEAGLINYVDNETPRRYFISGNADLDEVVAFAALIRQDENEACAKVCEQLPIPNEVFGAHHDYLEGKRMAVFQCAEAIRARMK